MQRDGEARRPGRHRRSGVEGRADPRPGRRRPSSATPAAAAINGEAGFAVVCTTLDEVRDLSARALDVSCAPSLRSPELS